MIHVATRKGVFRIARTAGHWGVAAADFLGDNASCVFYDRRDGALYAGLAHGHFGVKLHRSDDGVRWHAVTAPVYPERPAGLHDVEPNSRRPTPWSTQLIWTLSASPNDTSGAIWCGTIPGGLFRSTDRGATWQLVESLWNDPSRAAWFGGGYDFPGIHSVCVHPHNPAHLTAGISCGGVWRSTDAGKSWQCMTDGMYAEYMPPDRRHDPYIQDPHRVVQCRARPECLWAQHHNGVFRTVDDAHTWTDVPAITPSSFGFAVAVHPDDPDRAWFVPGISDEKRIPVDGRFVVTRTLDGGASFDVLTHGLPQTHAYDLVYRHAMDINEDGSVIAFGTTTGALFISEDAGNQWSCVTAHLPPIHALQFAA